MKKIIFVLCLAIFSCSLFESQVKKEPVKEIVIEKETIIKPSKYKAGGNVSSASKRADGCAIRGKTRA
jgi:hypothetical protein